MSSINPIWLLMCAVFLALVPLLIGLVTSYIKISIVLGLFRSGLGAQQVPSGLVVMALSFAMTLFVMAPTLEETRRIGETVDFARLAANPKLENLKPLEVLLEPWTSFVSEHAGAAEVAAFTGLAAPKSKLEGRSLRVLIPAFILSELKEAFAMGFVLLLPFLVVDLIVANILVGMGMYMVSPVMISLPLKLILFVLCDGWMLLTKGLIASYQL